MVLLGEGQTLRLRVGPFQEVRWSGAPASPDTSRLGTDPMYVGGRRKLVPSFSEERRPLALSCVCFGQLADVRRSADIADISQLMHEFEGAAKWYRLNIPPAKRQDGPTFEMRNQCSKKIKGPSGERKRSTKKSRTLSGLRKKTTQVEAAARKLLLHLGVRRLDEAPDGPGDGELLTFLAAHSGSSEEYVIDATARVGRLAELLEAIEAAKRLEACSYEAAQDAAKFAKLLPKGHQGDVAAIGWIEDMMSLYKKITGEEPSFSVRRPGLGRGQPTGPFLRFLQAAGKPLQMDFPPATISITRQSRSFRP